MHAMQTTVATTVGSTSGSLAFAWNMFFDIAADYWLAGHYACLWISYQIRIYNVPIGSNVRMTKLRNNKFVPIGSNVRMTKLRDSKFWRSVRPTKLGVRTEGPYTIERIHINGNLTILLQEGITERINIRRVLPYCWPFHVPLQRQFLAWIVFEDIIFFSDLFFSTSHLSEL